MRRNLLIAGALIIGFALLCFLALYLVFTRLEPEVERPTPNPTSATMDISEGTR